MNSKPWQMHSQSVEQAMGQGRVNQRTEALKMAGSKRAANPNERFFVWFEDNYGQVQECPTEHGSLVAALEQAAALDDEYNSDSDGDIFVVRGERIQIKKKSEFVVDTDQD